MAILAVTVAAIIGIGNGNVSTGTGNGQTPRTQKTGTHPITFADNGRAAKPRPQKSVTYPIRFPKVDAEARAAAVRVVPDPVRDQRERAVSRRRPPARRRTSRKSRRKQQAEVQAIAYGLVAVAAIAAFVAVVNWVSEHPWVLLVALVIGAAGFYGWLYQRQQRDAVGTGSGSRPAVRDESAGRTAPPGVRARDTGPDAAGRLRGRGAGRRRGRPRSGCEGHRPLRAPLGDPVQAPPKRPGRLTQSEPRTCRSSTAQHDRSTARTSPFW